MEGAVCVEGRCGCNSNDDCYGGFKCSSYHTCIAGSVELRSVDILDCSSLGKLYSVASCSGNNGRYTLKYENEVVAELNLNSKNRYNFNLSKTGTHYIKFTNLRSGAMASIVWEFETSSAYHEYENNQLKVSDGKNTQLYKLTNLGQGSAQFNMDSSSTTLTIEHAGSGTDALVIKTIIIM